MLTPYHPANFTILEDHPITRVAREQLPDLEPFVYFCKLTGYFGIGYFLEVDPRKIWPTAIQGVRVMKELVSLGQDINKVDHSKIEELRQRMRFNSKAAGEAVRAHARDRLTELHEFEKEQQSVRSWLTQTTGHDAPTSMWGRNKIRFSFGGRGGKKSKHTVPAPSFGSL